MEVKADSALTYDKAFFLENADGSLRSARVVAPIVMDLVHPNSVVDFGCGTGTWVYAFSECGVSDYLGLDGDYVDRSMLRIPIDRFKATDLTSRLAVSRKYDLAVCLEVAEHLPDTVSKDLIFALTEAADIVLFSAAIPGQGGTNHINEQWSWYWVDLFLKRDYVRIDAIRPRSLAESGCRAVVSAEYSAFCEAIHFGFE